MSAVIELLERCNVPMAEHGQHEHGRPGWVQVDCPLCSPDSDRMRLGYNTRGHYFNCWQCGKLATTKTLIQLTHLPAKVVREALAGAKPEPDQEVPHTGKLRLPAYMGPLRKAHRAYLRGRGFNPRSLAKLWDLQGIGLAPGGTSWRIVAPIIHRGETVSYTTRAIGKAGRWMSARAEDSAIEPRRLIYGLDYCRHAVVVVEGPSDVWRVGPGAAGLLGLGYSRAQVAQLARYMVRVVCLDSTPEAQRVARRLAGELAVFPGETHIVELDAEDPGSAKPREIQRLRAAFLD